MATYERQQKTKSYLKNWTAWSKRINCSGPNISRELLLNQLHISKNTFAQLIEAYSGTNFSGYINNKRLDYSIHLLEDYKRYTIEAVATDSGFSNVRSFYRIFREKYGMTPSEYRNTFEKE
ncbi:MAG: helix-turn-helix domain-containing protein [Parabacteroides johnsonii]